MNKKIGIIAIFTCVLSCVVYKCWKYKTKRSIQG